MTVAPEKSVDDGARDPSDVSAGEPATAPDETPVVSTPPMASIPSRGLDIGIRPNHVSDSTQDDAENPQALSYSLRVGVRHCSLEHAPYCILVGHFQGLPLTGAEARLNERSEGRLERLLLMNQYPQRLGDMAILQPVDEAPPNGMAVIGLGPSGELTAAELRAAITRTVVRIALQELDRRLAEGGVSNEWRPLGLSSVLIGTSPGGGLPVETSVRALIDGVNAANARLGRMKVLAGERERNATEIVRFEHLELTERYDDRVDLIVSVLAQLDELSRREAQSTPESCAVCRYVLTPERGEGASTANPPADTADEVWRRVDIRIQDDPTTATTNGPVAAEPIVKMEFTSIGRLARAERLLEPVERDLVNSLLTEAIDDHSDEDISGTLYELLVPHALKGELGSSEHLHLLVDERTADVPWELLSPRNDDEERRVPVALRVGVLRQFRDSEHLRFDLRRASGNNVLIIGNPPVPNAPPLPGAVGEASAVSASFGTAKWNVTSLMWDTSGKPIRATEDKPASFSAVDALHMLLNGDWRVVHIAAHGEFTGEPATTGVLLGALKLSPNTFSKMSVVPDLVILNCCHLGRVGPGPKRSLVGANRAAASVGRALLQLGVRAVVVAGWAVEDQAAQRFASVLVERLLGGANFGSAVIDARDAAHQKSPKSLTWGAYQCYGDPGFSLAASPQGINGNDVHTTGELRRRIGRLASSASDQGRSTGGESAANVEAIREQLVVLHQQATALNAPGAYADLADVWSRLLDFDEAVRWYEAALSGGDSDVPVAAIEQLGNLLSRRARQTSLVGGDRDHVDKDVESAQTWLARAIDLGESGERLALLGGHHKRVAAMSDARSDRDEHLRHAIASYARAFAVNRKEYHVLNCVQLVELARMNGVLIEAPVEADRKRVGERLVLDMPEPESNSSATGALTAANFWQRSASGDRLLTAILIDVRRRGENQDASMDSQPDRLAQDVECLVGDYTAAFRLRSNARERASVVEHLRDLADIAPADSALAKAFANACERLERWPAGLSSTSGG